MARVPLADRLWSKVDKNGPVPATRLDLGPCWIWTASTNQQGYGQIHVWRDDGTHTMRGAHRVAYELVKGPLPEGTEPDHLCRVRRCVNPDHQEPVTHLVNVRRGEGGPAARVRNRRISHCPHGHPYSPENTLYAGAPGYRICRICKRARDRARRAEISKSRPPRRSG